MPFLQPGGASDSISHITEHYQNPQYKITVIHDEHVGTLQGEITIAMAKKPGMC